MTGWDGYPWYLAVSGKRPCWMRTGRLLGEHGIPRNSQEGRREFGRQIEQRRQTENGPEQDKRLRRGWCFGDKGFRKELLGQMAERVGESHYGSERQESGKEKAERIVGEEKEAPPVDRIAPWRPPATARIDKDSF
jgi:hypothetical protein